MEEMATISLSKDRALVLYDLVARLNSRDDLPLEDQSEQRVLWDLEADLESQLAAVTAPDYKSRLESARDRIRDPEF